MIKKLAITGLACVCSLCISAEAFAYSTRSKIYFGADYVYSDIKYKNNTLYEMDDGYNGISPVIGFSSYGVGLEAWYMFSDKAENKHGYESELTAYGPVCMSSRGRMLGPVSTSLVYPSGKISSCYGRHGSGS